MNDKKCTCAELVEIAEDFIPMLFSFLCTFIFISLFYRFFGKSRELYWFTLTALFFFDVATIGLSVEYLDALAHICTCTCDEEV